MLAVVIMVTSMSAQAVACIETNEIQSANDSISISMKVGSLDQIQHAESDHSEESAPHANHCHCVNQICCGFIIYPAVTSVQIPSEEESSPLVSVTLISWNGTPPTRPPSA